MEWFWGFKWFWGGEEPRVTVLSLYICSYFIFSIFVTTVSSSIITIQGWQTFKWVYDDLLIFIRVCLCGQQGVVRHSVVKRQDTPV